MFLESPTYAPHALTGAVTREVGDVVRELGRHVRPPYLLSHSRVTPFVMPERLNFLAGVRRKACTVRWICHLIGIRW